METLVARQKKDAGEVLLGLLKDPYRSQLAEGSVWASLGTSIGFTLLLAIFFSLLRPYNSVVYAPKLKVADEKHAPPPMGKGVFAWLHPIIRTHEQDLLPLLGLDAIVFLRILRMCRNMFLVLSVLGCGILIPINLIKGVKFQGSTAISRLTPVYTFGDANWGMVICSYIFNAVVAGFLWWNYRVVLRLRRQYYDSPEYHASLHARTLMINDIPKEFSSDAGIGSLIDQVVPTSSFSRTAIARNVKELPELIEEHSHTVRELEAHLAKYLKDPSNLPASRPMCKPSKKDPAWGSYPKGQKLDAIQYLTGRIKELELEVKEVRQGVDNRNPLPYGFASYEEIEEAHNIAFAAKDKHPQGTTIVLAPRPNDIIWKNMPRSKSQRRTQRLFNSLWITLLTLLWVVPNAMIAIFLVNLSNLGLVWPGFQSSLAAHTAWWSIVQGVASPALTSLIYLVLPIIFRRLLIKAGDRTKTARERHVAGKLYAFFVFNFLFVFSVFSTLWTFISSVVDKTNSGTDAWTAIKEAELGLNFFIFLCDISPFWITWLLQRNLGAAVDLAQLWTLLYSFCARKFSSPTPRELIELTAPPAFDYASYYNYFLFYCTVSLCYATLQPLVLPACALYFALDVYLKKYLLLYIFVTKTESGGMFWRMFFNRIVFATMLSNCLVFLAVWVRGDAAHLEAYAMVPLPFLMVGFKLFCKKAFDDKIHYYIRGHAHKDPEANRSKAANGKNDRLSSRFGHPALYRPLITPMVHAKAQNILASVYGGRLTDSNDPSSREAASMSGYSDTYALDPMREGEPGRRAKSVKSMPGFEMVPESRLDFSYFKGRAEFGEDHGAGGGLFGSPEDIVRTDTPGSSVMFGDGDSRPGTPMTGRTFNHPATATPMSYDSQADIAYGRGRQIYMQQNDSQSALVSGAAEMPRAHPVYMGSQPHMRDHSQERRAPGFLGGGPQGYGGLPQHEDESDHMSYDYYRGNRRSNANFGNQGSGY